MSKGYSTTSTRSVQEARKNLTRFLRDIDNIPLQELEKSARAIHANAVAQAPYQTGKLEKSIYVRVSKDKRRPGLVAGASALSPSHYNYAGVQHENTHLNHPIKGKAHFIRDPFNQEKANLVRRIKRRLKVTK